MRSKGYHTAMTNFYYNLGNYMTIIRNKSQWKNGQKIIIALADIYFSLSNFSLFGNVSIQDEYICKDKKKYGN